MRRRLFNLAAAVSLVLCVATVALWVRSYWVADLLGYVSRARPQSSSHIFYSLRGNVLIYTRAVPPQTPPGWQRSYLQVALVPRPQRVILFPLSWESNPARNMRWAIRFSDWLAMALTAIAPALWLRTRWRGRRAPGLCPVCGYDLRATPDRCPECGAEAKPQPAEGAAA